MSDNRNLITAQKLKNDEFYTMYSDIENELQYYRKEFNNKIVYCNCDTVNSNFYRYFINNFSKLNLKLLITTSLNKEMIVYGGNDDVYIETLNNGSFDSEECINILQRADIVCTNPPFSIFRKYIDLLYEYNKKFLIVGSKNAIIYKNVFPHVLNKEMKAGINQLNDFIEPSGNIKKFGNVCWYTNLDYDYDKPFIELTKEYNANDYYTYINYNAINVNKVSDIPLNYDGVMGVPITFFYKLNPNQFEIVGIRKGTDNKDLQYYDRDNNIIYPYNRLLIKRR